MPASTEFPSIPPGDVDWFQFDFTSRIGVVVSPISSAVWSCAVSPDSLGIDVAPATRLVGSPINSGTVTKSLAGTMLDGVTYTLTASITLADRRILTAFADVECTSRPADVVDLPFTIAEFRSEFPGFSNPEYYSDDMINFWIYQAVNNPPIDITLAGQFYNLALRLWVAHNLALARMNARRGVNGMPLLGSGIPSSRSVGGVSISYDTQFGSETDGGFYSLTVYGSQFLRYLRMAGSAPIQL